MTELAEKIPTSVNNLSNKLRKKTIKFEEVCQIADILGYHIKFEKNTKQIYGNLRSRLGFQPNKEDFKLFGRPKPDNFYYKLCTFLSLCCDAKRLVGRGRSSQGDEPYCVVPFNADKPSRERNVPKKEKHADRLITTKLNLSGLTRFAQTKSALLMFR